MDGFYIGEKLDKINCGFWNNDIEELLIIRVSSVIG